MRKSLFVAVVAVAMGGCSKEEAAKPAPSASAAPSAAPSASAAESASVAPSAAASADLPPRSDCPAGSAGPGTFAKPCEAKGTDRMMEVKWKKTDDKGPSFNVVSKSKLVILYGRIAIYFYDKAGKQLQASPDPDTNKPRPFHACSGNIFQGVMKPGESALLTFSCAGKKSVPENTDSIEAEMQMVGFADKDGKKNEFYWRNKELTPDERPKGGVKK